MNSQSSGYISCQIPLRRQSMSIVLSPSSRGSEENVNKAELQAQMVISQQLTHNAVKHLMESNMCQRSQLSKALRTMPHDTIRRPCVSHISHPELRLIAELVNISNQLKCVQLPPSTSLSLETTRNHLLTFFVANFYGKKILLNGPFVLGLSGQKWG